MAIRVTEAVCVMVPLVAVTVIVYVPVGVLCAVTTPRVDDELGPTVDGWKVVGACRTAGETVTERATVPLKPFTERTTMPYDVELPRSTNSDDGVTLRVKSGLGAGVTVTDTVTECESVPVVPVTVTT